MLDIPVGSNYLTDPLLGPALAVDTARVLYHMAAMYNTGAQLPEHQRHLIYSLAGMGLVIGDYFAVRRYVDKQLESDVVSNKGSKTSSEADGIFTASIFFIYTPLLFRGFVNYRDNLPITDKIVDLVADVAVFGLVLSRQVITTQMLTNVTLCNSSFSKPANCPAPSVMKPFSSSI